MGSKVQFWGPISLCLFVFFGNENSARSFSDRSFLNPLGSWTSAPSGHGCPHRNACFSRISRAWPKFLPPDVRRDIRVDVRRTSGPKTYSLGCFFVPDFWGLNLPFSEESSDVSSHNILFFRKFFRSLHPLGFYTSILFDGSSKNKKSARSFSDRSFFMDVRAGCPCENACFFLGFGGPDRSFWPDVRKDIRPKTSSLGWIFVPEDLVRADRWSDVFYTCVLPTFVFGKRRRSWEWRRQLARLGNVSETPTPTTCLKSTVVHLRFVWQYAPHLYGSTFLASKLRRKGNPAIRLPFVLQYVSHLYGSMPTICTAVLLEKYWGLGSPERFWKMAQAEPETGNWKRRNRSSRNRQQPEPLEPFFRNCNRNWNRIPSVNTLSS